MPSSQISRRCLLPQKNRLHEDSLREALVVLNRHRRRWWPTAPLSCSRVREEDSCCHHAIVSLHKIPRKSWFGPGVRSPRTRAVGMPESTPLLQDHRRPWRQSTPAFTREVTLDRIGQAAQSTGSLSLHPRATHAAIVHEQREGMVESSEGLHHEN